MDLVFYRDRHELYYDLLAQRFIRFSYTSEAIFGGLAKLMPETAQPLVSAIAYIAVCWGFLYFLYRQRIFLKV